MMNIPGQLPGQQTNPQGAAQAMAAAGLLQQLAALEKTDPQEFDRVMSMLEEQAEQAKSAADPGGTSIRSMCGGKRE